jgi:hypothetical protein
MPTHVHVPPHWPRPHRHAGAGHPPAEVAPSILRMSALARLAAAAVTVTIAMIWGVVL